MFGDHGLGPFRIYPKPPSASQLQMRKQERYCSRQRTTKIGRGQAASEENLVWGSWH